MKLKETKNMCWNVPMEIKENEFFLKIFLSNVEFLTTNEKFILLNKLDSVHDLVILSIEEIFKLVSKPYRKFPIWTPDKVFAQSKCQITLMEQMGLSVVFYDDEKYPAVLREIPDPPFSIFYRGNIEILLNECISVVGTRKITPEGRNAAFDFSFDAASSGLTVISGLAYGVDAFAHKGALDAFLEGKSEVCMTAAVLPCGIDDVIPHRNKAIAAKIISGGGCLLSEWGPLVPAEKWRFVKRNRIVAALSRCTVVIQAPPGSGSMITAGFALDYDRDVMFHQAAFSEGANKVSEMVKSSLSGSCNGRDHKKMLQCPEKFIEDGAPVIKNFADYCRCLDEAPGKHNLNSDIVNTDGQNYLF